MNKLLNKIQLIVVCMIFSLGAYFSCLEILSAQVYNSTNFKVLDPVQTSGGGLSSSPSFNLESSINQIGIGTSSAAGFKINAGFLYFPFVTTPIVSATPGDGSVALSWTVATGVLGWNVGGYNVGQATNSAGPYTFGSSLGNVLSTTVGSLGNGTAYYFIVRAEDIFGNSISTSTYVSATPVATVIPPAGGGGGGGGGGFPGVQTAVIFSGKAYPKSVVTLLKDAQIAATTIAGSDASFQINLTNISGGNYIFSLYSEDNNGNRSSLVTFPVSVTTGATTNVSGIFIAPTIAVDKSEVKRGENVAIFGQSVPSADIVISVHSDQEYFSKTISDKNGIYLDNFDTSFLDYGGHTTKSKASIGNQLVSGYSYAVNFTVGTQTVLAEPTKKCPARGDLNNDCRVNLVDFSIASYWYKGILSDTMKVTEREKLNGDGKINLVDFSIMSFYWTG